jgi:hypothetical protein
MKFFLAAFGPKPEALDDAIGRLALEFSAADLGPIDFVSDDLPLLETVYYQAEMGHGLVKRYLSWTNLVEPGLLVDLKLKAMELEEILTGPLGRTVNLDPGYVFAGGLVLSTGKFSGHRLYLGRGVWGELTLHFHRGTFEGQPWTYRDFLKPEVLGLLSRIRASYMKAVRSTRS